MSNKYILDCLNDNIRYAKIEHFPQSLYYVNNKLDSLLNEYILGYRGLIIKFNENINSLECASTGNYTLKTFLENNYDNYNHGEIVISMINDDSFSLDDNMLLNQLLNDVVHKYEVKYESYPKRIICTCKNIVNFLFEENLLEEECKMDVPNDDGKMEDKGESVDTSLKIDYMKELVDRHVINIGDELAIRFHDIEYKAVLVDYKMVLFGGKKMSLRQWGLKVTEWKSINIYRIVYLCKNHKKLQDVISTYVKDSKVIVDEAEYIESPSRIFAKDEDDYRNFYLQSGSKYMWGRYESDSKFYLLKGSYISINDVVHEQNINKKKITREGDYYFVQKELMFNSFDLVYDYFGIDKSRKWLNCKNNETIISCMNNNFYEEDIKKIKNQITETLKTKYNEDFMHIDRKETYYTVPSRDIELILEVSHFYHDHQTYWYQYKPYLYQFENSKKLYAFSFLNVRKVFVVPYEIIDNIKDKLSVTCKESKTYWHVYIGNDEKGYYIRIFNDEEEKIYLNNYEIDY